MNGTLVIGIGNPLRGDDAAGPEAVRRLSARAIPGVTTRETRGEGLDLLDAWQGWPRVVLVDAVVSGAAPGTLHRWEGRGDAIPRHIFGRSTHTLSLAETIALGESLGNVPERLVLFGIEGAAFGTGEALSGAVTAALPALVAALEKELGGSAHA